MYVNIQVDAEREDTQGLMHIVDALRERHIRTTVFVTADFAEREGTLVHNLHKDGFEIALHGFYTGEQLASMSYEQQRDMLMRAKWAVEGCGPCGTYRQVVGFRPQGFSQNEDTYRILDELKIHYNSGFRLGQIYTEGHKEDMTPYRVEGHLFYAVPITTVPYAGRDIHLCDVACALDEGMTADQWGEALEIGWDRAVTQKEPLVANVHGWYTGDPDRYAYWQPFVGFLDKINGQGRFVRTKELVEAAISGR